MKIFDIVQLNFKQLIREIRKTYSSYYCFPAVFMLIFGIGFGDNVESDVDMTVINHDNASGVNLGNELVGVIKDFNSSENESLFTVHEVSSEDKAQKMLKTDLFLQF